MKRPSPPRRRPAVNITLTRASRLYRLITLLADRPRDRDGLLDNLAIGLRTFYRELDLLRRCAIKVQRIGQEYTLKTAPDEAQGRLPFPDPQLSFAEMSELARLDGDAPRRLAALLDGVIHPPSPPARARKRTRKG